MEERISGIKEKLYNKCYHMNGTWLNDCLDYYLTENANATDNDTLNFVTAQWQLSDLREISNEKGCLPRNLAQQKSTMLPGKYILQVDKGYDISTPKYKQLETMRKVSSENIRVTDAEENKPWEIKSKRMMQLFLTDGIQDISAIEYKPIRFLKDIILPGFKIMIKGPVVCKKGVILLDEANISEIGGEVEHLLISNATENVFARALNMPENPDPYNDTKQQNDDVALFDDDFDIDFDEIAELESNTAGNQGRPSPNPQSNPPQSSILMTPIDKQKSADLPVCFEAQAEVEDIKFPDDDDLLFDLINEDNIDNNSREFETHQQENSNRNPVNAPPVPTSNSAHNKEDDDLIVISDEELDVKTSTSTKDPPSASIKKSEAKELSDEQLEDFGSLDWEDFALEAEALKKIQAPINTVKDQSEVIKTVKPNVPTIFSNKSEPPGNNRNARPPRSPGPLKSASNTRENLASATAAQKRQSDMSSSLPSGSKILCTKNMSKNSVNSNGRGILDYFKKTDRSVLAERSPPKICDFICELKQLSLAEGVIRKKVWGRTKFLGKLGKGGGGWRLDGTITDGTENLDVEFASEVLEKELGFTVAEFAVQKKQRKNNPELEQKLRLIFRTADARLKNLDALVEIELSPNKKPKVMLIKDLRDSERNAITESKKRLGY